MGNVFGPVPSRRLGKSLGINNIPYKNCTYSCIYCQLGRTKRLAVKRKNFYELKEILDELNEKIKKIKEKKEKVDYICFVPDGEPTLDLNLSSEIEFLKKIDIPKGIITNSSLLFDEDVREALYKFDWVSLKIDSVEENIWRKINRPHKKLILEDILEGIIKFSKKFKGELVTETMVVKGLNDNLKEAENTSKFIKKINPSISYLAIPIRPPAEKYVFAPDEEKLNEIYQIFKKKIRNFEYLISYEGDDFSIFDRVKKEILSITSVHPIRKDALLKIFKKKSMDWDLINKLLEGGYLKKIKYNGKTFYIRNWNKKPLDK